VSDNGAFDTKVFSLEAEDDRILFSSTVMNLLLSDTAALWIR